MKRLNLILAAAAIVLTTAAARADERHEIAFPDLPGYKTLKCDFHMHTVFSDGVVWPTVRVDEAWRQGFDAIALSDHIEYQPHKADIPTKHNRPYELAAGKARMLDILFIKAAEITRNTPPGHFNALFLSDINPLETEDFVEVFKQAEKQGAFVFWNHQGWQGEELGSWRDVHTQLFDGKLFQGMEVCNGDGYFPSAHKWCMEKNLTMMGDSDIHAPDLRKKSSPHDHRTITLVFAKERTVPAIKEALQAGRTAVWFKDQIIGRREYLSPLFDKCVSVAPPHLRTKKDVYTLIHNACDLDIVLKRTGGLGPMEIRLPARSTSLVKIGTKTPDKPLELKYTATNFLVAPGKSLDVVLRVEGKALPAQNADASKGQIPWVPFTTKEFEKCLEQGKPVLVNFSADWCTTSKSLEANVLNTPPVRKVLSKYGVIPMKADWTHPKAEITKILESLGGKQIPTIAVFPAAKPNSPIVIKGGYTSKVLIEAVEKVASK